MQLFNVDAVMFSKKMLKWTGYLDWALTQKFSLQNCTIKKEAICLLGKELSVQNGLAHFYFINKTCYHFLWGLGASKNAWVLNGFYTITYKSRLTQKKLHNKTDGNLVSMGKTGLSHDIFFEFSVGPFEVVEVE